MELKNKKFLFLSIFVGMGSIVSVPFSSIIAIAMMSIFFIFFMVMIFYTPSEEEFEFLLNVTTLGSTEIKIYVHKSDINSQLVFNKIQRLLNSPPLKTISTKFEVIEIVSRYLYRCERCNISFTINDPTGCRFCGRKLVTIESMEYTNLVPVIKKKNKVTDVEVAIDVVPEIQIDSQPYSRGNRSFDESHFLRTVLTLEALKNNKRAGYKQTRAKLFRFCDFIAFPTNVRFPRPYNFTIYTKSVVDMSENPIQINGTGIMENPLIRDLARELKIVILKPSDIQILIRDFEEVRVIEKMYNKLMAFELGNIDALEKASNQYLYKQQKK